MSAAKRVAVGAEGVTVLGGAGIGLASGGPIAAGGGGAIATGAVGASTLVEGTTAGALAIRPGVSASV